jgi:hypothetical protein
MTDITIFQITYMSDNIIYYTYHSGGTINLNSTMTILVHGGHWTVIPRL